MRTDSPLLNGPDLCMSFREQKLRAQAGADEKVVRIRGCLAVVKKSRIEIAALKMKKVVKESADAVYMQYLGLFKPCKGRR